MSKRGKKTPDLFERPLKAGDYVLCGSSNYTDNPWHWYYGQIIAVRGAALWLARWTQNGDEYLQESTVYAVRAISTDTSELSAIRDQACEAVRELDRAVIDAESALGRARSAVEAKLQELARGGLKITPRDKGAIETDRAETNAIQETIETEDAARAEQLRTGVEA